jgi:LemA protein
VKKGLAVVVGIVAVLLLFACIIGGWLMTTYNGLVAQRNGVDAKWAQIDNQLKRRADLIPNLVQTVKGFAAHEQAAITAVTEARAKLAGATTPATKGQADTELTSALSRLLVVVENYPNLKADTTFRDLMAELAGTENRVAVARMDYNEAVRTYNTAIQTVPTSFVANAFGFTAKEFFQVGTEDKALPNVDFSK